ncbi:MAG: M3 family oligoendopeptidase [Candidatus Dormibacteria bacterium]
MDGLGMEDNAHVESLQKGVPSPAGPKASGVVWDLTFIEPSIEAAREHLADTVKKAAVFAKQWEGKLAQGDAATWARALGEFSEIYNAFMAVTSYNELRLAQDSLSTTNQDLDAFVKKESVQFANTTRFLELDWKMLPPSRARELSRAPALARYRHYLERLLEDAPHTLSAAEERALAERAPAAESAWVSLFHETLSGIVVNFDAGEGVRQHTIDELLAYRTSDNAALRERAVKAVYEALEPWKGVLAKCYDSLVGDRLAMDRLRRYVDTSGAPLPMKQANVANDLSEAVVTTMLKAVEDHYGIVQAYYRKKAVLFGVQQLQFADQYAPIGKPKACTFDEARKLVLSAVNAFSPNAAGILEKFFTENRIDAEPRKGKTGGAFCSGVAQNKKPVVLMNYTDTVNDAMTLAHELGHGLHFTLAQQAQTPFECETGMAMAEVASTFNEMLLFDYLLDRESDPAARQALIASRIEDSCATIFRQTMMARYEERAYAARERGESLGADRLSDIWFAENEKEFGDALLLPEGYRLGWSYIPHFIGTRFYTYSYSFAHLTSLALYAKYKAEGQPFVARYLDLLRTGGAKSPEALLQKVGIDLTDPAWVEPAFALISQWTTKL